MTLIAPNDTSMISRGGSRRTRSAIEIGVVAVNPAGVAAEAGPYWSLRIVLVTPFLFMSGT